MANQIVFTALPSGWRNVFRFDGKTIVKSCPGVLVFGPLHAPVFANYHKGTLQSVHVDTEGTQYVTTLAPGEKWEN